MLIGYARCGNDEQGERDQLVKLGVEPGQIHVDHGLSGIDRPWQELSETLGAVSVRDTLVVTVLDWLARSRDVKPKLTPERQAEMFDLYERHESSVPELMKRFSLSQPAVYQYLARERTLRSSPEPTPDH